MIMQFSIALVLGLASSAVAEPPCAQAARLPEQGRAENKAISLEAAKAALDAARAAKAKAESRESVKSALGDVASYTADEMLALRGVGRTSLNEVMSVMRAAGLPFG
jgi:DNA-directed RNA polymerase alpha subunit